METINWFEIHFFGSEIINGPITQSWGLILILIILTFIGYTTTILSVMIFTSKFFFKKKEAINQEYKEEEISQESGKIKQFSIFIIFYFIFFGVWFLTSQILDWMIFWIVPLFLIALFLIYDYFKWNARNKEVPISNWFKGLIKTEFNASVVLYSLFSSFLFLMFFIIISMSIPFAFFRPNSIGAFLLSIILVPFYTSMELLYRKLLLPSLEFIHSKKRRTFIIVLISFPFQFFLIFLSYWYYWVGPVFIAMTTVYLFVTMMNTIIFHKTGKFYATMLNTLIVMGFFAGAAQAALLKILGL